MDAMTSPIGEARQGIVCPNCGLEQAIEATADPRCERCGQVLSANASGVEGQPLSGVFPAQADPIHVPAPMASGGIGRISDGTQVTHSSTSAVPGKPVAPIADDPAGNSTLEGQAMDPPLGAHAERGGSG